MNIAILTNFTEFMPGYSLTGIVKDQVRMLTRYGHNVFLFVDEKYKGTDTAEFGCTKIMKVVPHGNLSDYQSKEGITPDHVALSLATAQVLSGQLKELEIDVAFTHDWIFTGWNLPYGMGVKTVSPDLPGVLWMHWIHSLPCVEGMIGRDWWILPEYGQNHFIIYPNQSDRIRVAEAFRTSREWVRVIPHIKDLRTFFNFQPETCQIIDYMPALMQADIVQIYPAGGDRMIAKRTKELITIFGKIAEAGFSVALLIANQWATQRKHREDVNEYIEHAEGYGLVAGSDFLFSSMIQNGKYSKGIPHEILRELMMLANLFIFPTREETFGLVLPEISLASGALCVVNKSLRMMAEVSGNNTLAFDFGSYEHNFIIPDEIGMDGYMQAVAMATLGRMQQDDGIMTKSFMRKTYNMDNIYAKYYAPGMAEMRMHV